ncbi:MAG: hypothetical protein JO173_08095 [Gammaproteobacteria bacterium]|nr:hypothetical protein [Gammaproteobacteria bacterium]
MQTAPCRDCARRRAFAATAVMVSALSVLCGCVASKYRLAKKDTPPAQVLGIAFPDAAPLQATLASLITYGGPGSWKREALWDEYVVQLVNQGDRPLTVDAATLLDFKGTSYAAGSDPWALEKQSRELERQYRDHGEAFLRTAGPGVAIVGAGAVAGPAATAAIVSPVVAGAAIAAVVVLPVYYVSVLGINHHNRNAVMAEFGRRRLALPLALAPGETRTGSLFFPMVRGPGSLALHGTGESAATTATLPLGFLSALHVPTAPAGDGTR